MIKNIYNTIKNLIYWFGIIKNDRWYDYLFLDIIVQHKLKQMRHGFMTKSDIVDAKVIANQIKEAIDDLDILIKDTSVSNKELRKKVYTFIGEHSNTWWD